MLRRVEGTSDHPPDESTSENERRVLILAPTGNDARLTAEFLSGAGMHPVIVSGLEELTEKIGEGCGAVLVAEEVLTSRTAPRLYATLNRQPKWSDLPVTLITRGGIAGAQQMRRLTVFERNSNVSVLERPFRPATLVSTVEVALRSRQRQYEVRKLLAELREARDSAENANRAKDEFLAALSHELRTPLNPALLLATEAANDLSLRPDVRRVFEQIARSILLEARLIDDLLDVTRITQGKLSLDLHPLDAHVALQGALATTKLEIIEKGISVALDLHAKSPIIQADAVRLQQILWNVLKNAAKFTPAGGTIRIETTSDENELVVRITDTGVGMDPWELTRVFDAFVQGDHARTNGNHRFGGLGLGLAITRRLVELHGGKIAAASEGQGKGATFSITFPLAGAGAAERRAEPGPKVRSGGRTRSKRILVVEDHAPTRVSLMRLLERRGYEAKAAENLAQARALAADTVFDIVLSDIGLPDGSGYELMLELGGHSGLAGIALSGYGMESDVMQSKAAGFVAHLTKPVSVHALDAALERIADSDAGIVPR